MVHVFYFLIVVAFTFKMAQCTGAVSPGEVVRKAFPELLNYLGELSKTFDQRRNCLNMELSLPFISSFNQARSISPRRGDMLLTKLIKSVPTKEKFKFRKRFLSEKHLACCFFPCVGVRFV